MPSLQIRGLPEPLYNRLSQVAESSRRSLAQQIIITLQKGLGIKENARARRERLVSEMAESPLLEDAEKFRDPAEIIREDRQR